MEKNQLNADNVSHIDELLQKISTTRKHSEAELEEIRKGEWISNSRDHVILATKIK